MTSEARIAANRRNAAKSTGPKTEQGKAVVAQNAVKHGLLARAAVLQGEDWEEFTEFRENLIEELGPEGTLEGMLAERIVSLSWRLQRAARLQNEAYESLYLKEATSAYGKMMRAEMARGRATGAETSTDDLIGGRLLVDDFAGTKVLDRMLLYERRIEHSLYRTMGELKKLRLRREVSSLKCEVSREQGRASGTPSLPTENFTLPTATEPPYGVTTNAVAISMEPPASPQNKGEILSDQEPATCGARPGRSAETAGREPEGDSAKQSQFGADQNGTNSCWREGLRQERGIAPLQEQTQNEGCSSSGADAGTISTAIS
jgi:hypothetical protein